MRKLIAIGFLAGAATLGSAGFAAASTAPAASAPVVHTWPGGTSVSQTFTFSGTGSVNYSSSLTATAH